MAYEFILTERFDGVAVITLNRPDKLNALSFPLVRELDEALTQYEADDDIKAVILTGAGERAFSAGADIHEMAGLSAEELAHAPGGPRPRHLAHRDLCQAADRRDQRARLWRRGTDELDPRPAHRLRAHRVSLSGGELWPGQFDLVVAAAGRSAEGQGAALHRAHRRRRGGRAHRPVEPGRPGRAANRHLSRNRTDDRQERRAHGAGHQAPVARGDRDGLARPLQHRGGCPRHLAQRRPPARGFKDFLSRKPCYAGAALPDQSRGATISGSVTTTSSLTVSSTAQLNCRPLRVARFAGRARVDHQHLADSGAPADGGCGRRGRNRRRLRRTAPTARCADRHRSRAAPTASSGRRAASCRRACNSSRCGRSASHRSSDRSIQSGWRARTPCGPRKPSSWLPRIVCAPRSFSRRTTSFEKRYSQMLSPRQISSSTSPIRSSACAAARRHCSARPRRCRPSRAPSVPSPAAGDG